MQDLYKYRDENGTMEGHRLCREAIMVQVEFKDGVLIRLIPFTRDEQDNVDSFDAPRDLPEDTMSLGRMSNFMKPEKNMDIPDEILEEVEASAGFKVVPTKTIGIHISGSPSQSYN